MANNGKRKEAGASTSFRPDEVDAMMQLFSILNRGGDASTVARSVGVTTVQQKFARMQLKMRRESPQIDEPEAE